jgi:hypothetical protein
MQSVRERLKDENDMIAISQNILKAVGLTQNMTGLPKDSQFKIQGGQKVTLRVVTAITLLM